MKQAALIEDRHLNIAQSGPDNTDRSDEIAISCYENEVPPFTAAEIDRIYHHLNASLSHFDIRKEVGRSSTYVVRKGGEPITVLLFQHDKDCVKVVNEMLSIGQDDIARFANTIFARYQSVNVISFHMVHTEIHRFPYPHQLFNFSEDIVVTLPATPQAYQASLGKNMRRNLKRYTEALLRDFPSYQYQVCNGQDVDDVQVREIIELNRARITAKSQSFGIGNEEVDWIIEMVEKCGLVGLAKIDGRICAGAISFRIGDHFFMHVIAHDKKFDDYSLGIVCYYHTICEGIVRGAKEFHFSWGRYEYKYRLLGVQRNMAHLDVYRSRLAFLRKAAPVLRTTYAGTLRAARVWMLDAERRNTPFAIFVTRIIRLARKLKRFRRVPAA